MSFVTWWWWICQNMGFEKYEKSFGRKNRFTFYVSLYSGIDSKILISIFGIYGPVSVDLWTGGPWSKFEYLSFWIDIKAAWSPNDKLLLTGTSREHKNDGPGRLVFMHRETLETVKEIEVGMRSVVSIMWHHRHVSTIIRARKVSFGYGARELLSLWRFRSCDDFRFTANRL